MQIPIHQLLISKVGCSLDMVTIALFILTMFIAEIVVSINPGIPVEIIHFKTLIPIIILQTTMIIFAQICILHNVKVALPSLLHSVAKNMIMYMADYSISFQITLNFYICIKSVKVYVDNIGCFSYHFGEHLQTVSIIFHRLENNGFTIRPAN